jgi:hypothetical protein
LFALAVAVQALAPVAADFAMAKASGDGASFEICVDSGGVAHHHRHHNRAPGHDGSDACPLCQVCCSGVALIEAKPDHVGMAPVQWTPLAWTAADRVLAASRRDHAHQARAPPSFS